MFLTYLPQSKPLDMYTYACAGFLARRAWIKAIKKGNFIGWPMLAVENVNKHFPESEETVKGHMNHQQQGVRSTKPKDFQEPDASSEIGKKESDVYIKVVDLWNPKEIIYTDQTGAFPITVQNGARYVMVVVSNNRYECNCVMPNQEQDWPRVNKILQNTARNTARR